MYFNVLIVGASSLGKTTFIDVFLSNVVIFFILFINFFFFLERNLKKSTKFDQQQLVSSKQQVDFSFFKREILVLAKIKYEKFHFFLKMIDTPGFTHSTNMRSYWRNLKKNIVERVSFFLLLKFRKNENFEKFSKYKKNQMKKEKKDYFQSQKEKIVKETVDERVHIKAFTIYF